MNILKRNKVKSFGGILLLGTASVCVIIGMLLIPEENATNILLSYLCAIGLIIAYLLYRLCVCIENEYIKKDKRKAK